MLDRRPIDEADRCRAAFYNTARGYETYLLIGLGTIILTFLGWHITRRRARRKASPDTTTNQDPSCVRDQ